MLKLYGNARSASIYPGFSTLSEKTQKDPPNSIVSDTRNGKDPNVSAARSFLLYLPLREDSSIISENQLHIRNTRHNSDIIVTLIVTQANFFTANAVNNIIAGIDQPR
jgi:hypothetical protein